MAIALARVVTEPTASSTRSNSALGIAPGWGGAGRLVGHVGSRTALKLLANAAPIDASEGAELGLFDARGEDAVAEAEALLQPLLGHPPVAIRAVKAQIVAARRGDRAGETRAFSEVWGGPAHRAALSRIAAAGKG